MAALAATDVGALVLAYSAVVRLRQPQAFAALLRTIGIGAGGRVIARSTAILELASAAAVVVVGGRVPLAVLAALFAAFAALTAAGVRSGRASCGCFGDRSAPPAWSHVLLDASIATAAVAGALLDTSSLVDRLSHGLSAAVPYAAFTVLGAWMCVALMTSAAELAHLRTAPSAARARVAAR